MKIPIPAENEEMMDEMKHWAKRAYHQSLVKLGWYQAQRYHGTLPIEMAAYAEEKTLGLWRLLNPTVPGQKSPLQVVIEAVRPYIVPTRWGAFRREFVARMKLAFMAIHQSNYDPAMVADMNREINRLLAEYEIGSRSHPRLEFVLEPETAENCNSTRFLEIRSRIWERFTGKPLDLSLYRPGSSPYNQMAMHLDFHVEESTPEQL